MRYRVRVVPEAEWDIRHLPGFVRQRVRRQVEELRMSPRPSEAKELDPPCPPGFYCIRFERYRLVWRVDDQAAVVRVLRAGLKEGPEFYEDLPEG